MKKNRKTKIVSLSIISLFIVAISFYLIVEYLHSEKLISLRALSPGDTIKWNDQETLVTGDVRDAGQRPQDTHADEVGEEGDLISVISQDPTKYISPDNSISERIIAIVQLGRHNQPDHSPSEVIDLLKPLTTEEDIGVVRNSISALGQIAIRTDRDTREAVIRHLGHIYKEDHKKNDGNKIHIVETLGEIKTPLSTELLSRTYDEEEIPLLKYNVVSALVAHDQSDKATNKLKEIYCSLSESVPTDGSDQEQEDVWSDIRQEITDHLVKVPDC